jgi:hypothetical protein
MRADLRHVLLSLAFHRTDVGYIQGMNFVVAFMLVHLSPENTFWLFADTLEKVPPNFYLNTVMEEAVIFQVGLSRVIVMYTNGYSSRHPPLSKGVGPRTAPNRCPSPREVLNPVPGIYQG